jgi:hypothetical protein
MGRPALLKTTADGTVIDALMFRVSGFVWASTIDRWIDQRVREPRRGAEPQG